MKTVSIKALILVLAFNPGAAAVATEPGQEPGQSAQMVSAGLPADDPLPRQAALGFRTAVVDGMLSLRDLQSGSPAAAVGLRDGDILTAINGRGFDKPYQGEAALERLDAGDPIRLTVRRNGRSRTVSFVAPARPLEAMPGVVSHYGSVRTPDGAHLRTIITRPEDSSAPLPPLLFTQWVSCGSVEFRAGSQAREILASLARTSGLSLVRVERSTSGDSEGPACHELDYETELAHYLYAFRQLLAGERLDSGQIYIYGSSLGSTTAPLVAHALQQDGYDIAGVAVQGGGAETYYERMLTFDRQYLERRPEDVDPARIHGEMIRRAKFHYEYLINDRDPDEIAKDSPAMASIRKDILGMGDGQHYGRPYQWHQQAARKNFLEAWVELDAPVLVIFNEFDQFEARYGHEIITDFINRERPGTATFVQQEAVGHSNFRYESVVDAYAFRDGEPVGAQTAAVILDWIADIRR